MTSNDDNSKMVLIQLKHYFNNSKAVHFKLFSGEWRNAIIRSIDEQEQKVYIKEFLIGTLEYRFDEIISDSICEYNLNHNQREE